MSQYEQDDFQETSFPVQEQAVVCVQTMDPERSTMPDERIVRIQSGSVYADIFNQAKESQIRSIIAPYCTLSVRFHPFLPGIPYIPYS